MPATPEISDAEWTIMDLLWSRSPLTANDVVEAFSAGRSWNPRTIKTFLARLVKKGALKYASEGNRYLYRPAVTREQCVRKESRSFLGRVFAGNSAAAVAHFVDVEHLTDDQLHELQQLLAAKRKEKSR